jgi:hypothetical protein
MRGRVGLRLQPRREKNTREKNVGENDDRRQRASSAGGTGRQNHEFASFEKCEKSLYQIVNVNAFLQFLLHSLSGTCHANSAVKPADLAVDRGGLYT